MKIAKLTRSRSPVLRKNFNIFENRHLCASFVYNTHIRVRSLCISRSAQMKSKAVSSLNFKKIFMTRVSYYYYHLISTKRECFNFGEKTSIAFRRL